MQFQQRVSGRLSDGLPSQSNQYSLMMSDSTTTNGGRKEQSIERSVEWELAKQLLDAHSQTGRALEQYLILSTLREESTNDNESIEAAIEQAIEDHEQIIETLTAARETLKKVD